MKISSLQKTTLVDFPGKVAATVFTRGCSFACPFCHNPELVLPKKFLPLMDEEKILEFFEKRAGQLGGVCITGGEPTLQPDLPEFIVKLKKLGYAVKLDTNGWNPEILKKLIDAGNIDYIAMDIKAAPNKYLEAAGIQKSKIKNQNDNKKCKNSQPNIIECHSGLDPESSSLSFRHPDEVGTRNLMSLIKKSIKLIMSSGIDYEFRTTVVRPIHEVKDFEEIGKLIKGAKRYYIQNFVRSKHIDEHQKFKPFTDEELLSAQEIAKQCIKKVNIR